MTRHAIVLLALMMSGCGPKSGGTDTETGTGMGTGTDTDTNTPTSTGTGTGTGTGTETGTETDADTGPLTGTGGDQPAPLDPSGCLSQCAADVDPGTAILEANCNVCDFDPVVQTCGAIVPCEDVMGAWTIPAGQEACFAVHADAGNDTPSPLDDLSPACVDGGSNVEISVERSGAAPAGTFVAVTCEWSTNPAKDCPNLMTG